MMFCMQRSGKIKISHYKKARKPKSIFDHNSLYVLYSVTQNIITKVAL